MSDQECNTYVNRMKESQRVMNASLSDLVLSMSIEKDFNEWFDNAYEFKFGMRWAKARFRKISFKAYLAGHKLKEAKHD